MITEVKADLLEFPVQAIFHCANCFNVMGGGVAKSIKTKYPEAFQADSETVCGSKAKLGKFSFAQTEDAKLIYNLYGQYKFGAGRQINYEALYQAIEAAKLHSSELLVKTIGVPYRMGCGLAGGNWGIVYAMLEAAFKDSSQDLYVCKF